MFSCNKKEMTKSKTPSSKPSSTSYGLNSLVEGTQIDGTIKSDSDIRIDGAIKGKLTCTAKVIIGPTGKVSGEVFCKNAVIEGTFDGVLNVDELLNVRETAKVDGDVRTNKLIIQSGAVFNVSCVMGETSTLRAPKPQSNKDVSKKDNSSSGNA